MWIWSYYNITLFKICHGGKNCEGYNYVNFWMQKKFAEA